MVTVCRLWVFGLWACLRHVDWRYMGCGHAYCTLTVGVWAVRTQALGMLTLDRMIVDMLAGCLIAA